MFVDAATETNLTMQSKTNVIEKVITSCKTFFQRLIIRKSMGQIQLEIEIQNEMRRSLKWFHSAGIGLGCIIGMGIFDLGGQAAAKYSGPSVIISFLITGIVAFLAALSFSEMSSMMSTSGSAYTYTYAALGEYAAWFIGWNFALLYQLAALTVVAGWSKYVVHFIQHASNSNVTSWAAQAPVIWNEAEERFIVTGQAINVPAVAITLAITVILILGIRVTAIVNLVLVIIKIIILLIFIFACCKYVDRDNYAPFFPPNLGSFGEYGVTGMLQACTSVVFAYVGFESVATVAQEAKSATHSLPLAIFVSLTISMLIYIGIIAVIVGLVPYTSLDTVSPLTKAVQATPHGLWLLLVMDLGAIASLATVALISLLSQTRIFYAMALDGLLPPVFARVHSYTKIPWISTIISGVFCTVVSALFPVDIVGETASLAALITYLFVHIDVIVLRYTQRDSMNRTFKVPLGSWFIPILGSLLCILLMKGVTKATALRFLVWTAIGQIIYFSYGFWRFKRNEHEQLGSLDNRVELVLSTESTPNESESNSVNVTIESEA